jgi:hypothetical protein
MSRRTRSSSRQPQPACPATGMEAEGRTGPAPAPSAAAAAGAAANAAKQRVGAKRARADPTFTEEDYSCPICLNLLLVSWDSRERQICRLTVGQETDQQNVPKQTYRVYFASIRIRIHTANHTTPYHQGRRGAFPATGLRIFSSVPCLACRTRWWAPAATTSAPTASASGLWTGASRPAPPAARRWPLSCPGCAVACSAPWRRSSQR